MAQQAEDYILGHKSTVTANTTDSCDFVIIMNDCFGSREVFVFEDAVLATTTIIAQPDGFRS